MPARESISTKQTDSKQKFDEQNLAKKLYETAIIEISSKFNLIEISNAVKSKIELLLSKISVERAKNKIHFETVVLKEIDEFEINNPRIEGIFNVRAELRKHGKEVVREDHEKQKRAIAETKRLIEEAILSENIHPYYLKKIVKEMASRYGFTQEQIGNITDILKDFEESKNLRNKIFQRGDKSTFKTLLGLNIEDYPNLKIINGPFGIEIYADKDTINEIFRKRTNESDHIVNGFAFTTYLYNSTGVRIFFSEDSRPEITRHERNHNIFNFIYGNETSSIVINKEFKKLSKLLKRFSKEKTKNQEKINELIKDYFQNKNKILRRYIADEMLAMISDERDKVDEKNPQKQVQRIFLDRFFQFIDYGNAKLGAYSFIEKEVLDKQDRSLLPYGESETKLFISLNINLETITQIKREVFIIGNSGTILRIGLAVENFLKQFPDSESRTELINNLSIANLSSWESTIKNLTSHKLNNQNR